MKNPNIYLEHILESINKIELYTKGHDIDSFTISFMTHDAVIRQLEIIGEAVNNLESDFLDQHPNLPWKKMISMRNKLIHEYFGVDMDIVWQTIKKRIPELGIAIKEILNKKITKQ